MEEIWDRSLAPQMWNRYHNQLDIYLGLAGTEPLDILDVGCAQGTLALLLAERGHRVTAVDLRQEFLDYARSRHTHGQVHFLQSNVLEQDVPGLYDLVYANQLIEHLVYPAELLARLKRNLKPGGKLVVTTPNARYILNKLPTYRQLGNPASWAHMQHTSDSDGHFYAYLAEELAAIFSECGFENVRCRFFETPAISGHLKVRYLHALLPSGPLKIMDHFLEGLPWLGMRLSHQLLVSGTAPT